MFDLDKILLISRFDFFWSKHRLSVLTILFFALNAPNVSLAQATATNSVDIIDKPTKPLAVYKQNQLADISDDGKYLLFFQTKVPFRSYSKPLDGRPAVANQPPVYDDLLRVVEYETGREIAQRGIMDFPSAPQFIPGTTQVFYKELLKAKTAEFIPKIWNYESGETKQCPEIGKSLYSVGFIDGNSAYGTIYDDNKSLGSFLAKLSLSDCKLEVFDRIYPLDVNNRVRNNTVQGGIKITPDRKLLAYLLDSGDKIIFRNAENREIAREISALPLYFWWQNEFTADGKFLIANAASGQRAYRNASKDKFYLLVFDMKTFQMIRQIEIPGDGTIAVSPDSRLIAASYKSTKKVFLGNVEQSHIVIYDLATGKEVRKISLPPLRESRKDPFRANIGSIMFTDDGKRLLTGTYDTFVWDISDL